VLFNNKKKNVIWVLLLVLLIFIGNGCEQEGSSDIIEETEEEIEEEIEIDEDVYIGGELIAEQELFDAALAEGKLVVYTSHIPDQELEVIKAFRSRFPNIEVDMIRLVGGRLYERVVTEASANQLDADIIIMTDAALMEGLYDEGILAEHYPPSDDMYDYKRHGYWYPVDLMATVIKYNSELVSEEDAPKDWLDLLDPKWKGKIGLVHGGAGGSTWTDIYFQRKVLGLDFWVKLSEQEPMIFTGTADLVRALIGGEILVANSSTVGSYKQKVYMDAPVEWVYPLSGFGVSVFTGGVVEGAKNPNAARLFINWYLSQEGQTRLTTACGTYSAREDVLPPIGVNDLYLYDYFIPDIDGYIDLREPWVEEWNEIYGW
jgi:iron(III) transport system substrate-binding protein